MTRKVFDLETYFLLFLLCVFVIFFIVSMSYPLETGRLPMLLSGSTIILIIARIAIHLKEVFANISNIKTDINWRKSLLGFGMMAVSLFISYLFGLVLGSIALVFGNGYIFGAKKIWLLFLISFSTGLLLYIIFEKAFGIHLYAGVLFKN